MSTLEQKPSGSSKNITREELAEQHIYLQPGKQVKISETTNIVIGPNGSGKTRLLKVVKSHLERDGNKDILYGYFPDLSPQWRTAKSGTPQYSLREFLQKDNVTFNDFFKEIESQHRSFLDRLLDPESVNIDEEENTPLLAEIGRTFEYLTKKQLYKYTPPKGPAAKREPKSVLRVKSNDGSPDMTLAEALKLFSPGERMLFYMSLFFALKKPPVKGRPQVIILDEPEAHLHPDALIKFVKGLRENFPEAWIWIATHSLFLLPLFTFENIIYMEDSRLVPRDSQLYEKVLSSMLGPHRETVKEFFTSLPYWQYCDFIAECFTTPEVVDTADPADPQVEIFLKALRDKKFRKVLDYGGGSGRLGRSVEAANAHDWEDVKYHIFDTVKRDAGESVKVIDNWDDAEPDYDCVVMMNVLHEMEPNGTENTKGWCDTFKDIREHMAKDGFLLFVEVEALHTGEYPSDTGYLLLGPDELQELFCLNEPPKPITAGKNGRHRGYLIHHKHLWKVDQTSVNAAIQYLEVRTYNKIKELRAKGQDQTNSRKYAFLLQQYINAKLFNE